MRLGEEKLEDVDTGYAPGFPVCEEDSPTAGMPYSVATIRISFFVVKRQHNIVYRVFLVRSR